MSHRLSGSIASVIDTQEYKLTTLLSNLKQHSPSVRIKHSIAISQLSANQLHRQINQVVYESKQTLAQLNSRLKNATSQIIKQQQNQLASHANALGHLSPLSTLSRGYSITVGSKNQVLTSITHTQSGQTIKTRLSDGVIHSKVEKIEKN
ncbi:hypothetical protein OAM82_03535 [Candidatus Thioglobus sp.]|nr:hypothetical protein [Candidatus Thioglobus sp.]